MPGAGGARAARYMVTAAPKDGSYISMINPGAIPVPLMRPSVGFDTREMKWLGSMSGRAYTIGVWHTSPVKNIDDAKKQVVIMGTTGKSSTSYLIPSFMNKTIGTKFKIITGLRAAGPSISPSSAARSPGAAISIRAISAFVRNGSGTRR